MHDEEVLNLKQLKAKEVLHLLISAAVIGFIISFRHWGLGDEADPVTGLATLLVAAITALIILFLRVVAQKWVAYKMGYYTTYRAHKWGLPLSIFLALFLYGITRYVSPGELHIQESKRLRLGAFRYGLKYSDLALISLAAPAVCVFIMFFIKPIALLLPDFGLLNRVIETVAAIAFFGLAIPLNGSEGLHVLYYRRWLWIFTTAFVGAYFLLILATNVFSYLVAVAFGTFALWFYNHHIDK